MILQPFLTKPEARKAIEELRPDLVEIHRKLINDTGLARRCLANFQRDGRYGFYDPEWQSQAREAFERHRSGDFDEYLKWKVYQDWPILEELHKTREKEKAEAEAQAAKMAEEMVEKPTEEQEGDKDQEQLGIQTPSEDQSQSTHVAGNQEQDQEREKDIQTEAQAQVQLGIEAQAPDMTEEQEQHKSQHPTEASEKLPEEVEPAIADTDIVDGESNDLSGLSTTATSDHASPSPAQPSSTTAPDSERLPSTPPREHSPDVQCVTDSQGLHSPSLQPVLEDLPKPLADNVQLNILPENAQELVS